MQAVQRDYKLSSYSLNSVSAHFLGEQVRFPHFNWTEFSDVHAEQKKVVRWIAVYFFIIKDVNCLPNASLGNE